MRGCRTHAGEVSGAGLVHAQCNVQQQPDHRRARQRQVVASQLLADDPPEIWQTIQRLSALGYDWHDVMYMIAELLTEGFYQALKEHRQFYPWRLRPAAEPTARRLAATAGTRPALTVGP